jgi:hypothetical protein
MAENILRERAYSHPRSKSSHHRAKLVVPPPPQVLVLPAGIYGISFDLRYHTMVDHLPDGWGMKSTSESLHCDTVS